MYSGSLYYCSYLLLMVLCTQWNGVESDCNVVSKKEWGGAKPKYLEYLARPVQAVVVLATGTDSCSADESCQYILKNIQDDHINKLGYGDIAPAFLIGGNGKIYEGSGWFRVGNHTRGLSKESIGIAFIGTFRDVPPTIEALDATQELLACGVSEGHITPDYMLFMQSQLFVTYTEDNYKELYTVIKSWPHWTERTPFEWLPIQYAYFVDNLPNWLPFLPEISVQKLREHLYNATKKDKEVESF